MHECLECMCVVDVRSDPIGECCGVVYVLLCKCELPHYDLCERIQNINSPRRPFAPAAALPPFASPS